METFLNLLHFYHPLEHTALKKLLLVFNITYINIYMDTIVWEWKNIMIQINY
jgi:hypothetical protein